MMITDREVLVGHALAKALERARDAKVRGRSRQGPVEIDGKVCFVLDDGYATSVIGYDRTTGAMVGGHDYHPDRRRDVPLAELAAYVLGRTPAREHPEKLGSGLGRAVREFAPPVYGMHPSASARPSVPDLARDVSSWRTLEDILLRIDTDVVRAGIQHNFTTSTFAWLGRRDGLHDRRISLFVDWEFAGADLAAAEGVVDAGLTAGESESQILLRCLVETGRVRPQFLDPATRNAAIRSLEHIRACPGSVDALGAFRDYSIYGLPAEHLPRTVEEWDILTAMGKMVGEWDEINDIKSGIFAEAEGDYAGYWAFLESTPMFQAAWAARSGDSDVDPRAKMVNAVSDVLFAADRGLGSLVVAPLLGVARSYSGAAKIDPIIKRLVLRGRSYADFCLAWPEWRNTQERVAQVVSKCAAEIDTRWPSATYRNPIDRDGLRFRWITTPADLVATPIAPPEQAELECNPAPYLTACLAGLEQILEVSKKAEDGWVPVSFARIVLGLGGKDSEILKLSVDSHLGADGGPPDPAAASCLEGFVADANAGRIAADIRAFSPAPGFDMVSGEEVDFSSIIHKPEDRLALLRAFDSLLSPQYRGLSMDEFADAVAAVASLESRDGDELEQTAPSP